MERFYWKKQNIYKQLDQTVDRQEPQQTKINKWCCDLSYMSPLIIGIVQRKINPRLHDLHEHLQINKPTTYFIFFAHTSFIQFLYGCQFK